MSSVEASVLRVKAVRYDVARLRLMQLILPVAVIVTTAARRSEGYVLYGVAALLLIAVFLAWSTARRSLGVTSVCVVKGKIQLGDMGETLVPSDFPRWTMIEHTARLYRADLSWMFRAESVDALLLRNELSRVLGQPLVMRRRGSARARGLSLAVSIAGALATVLAVYWQTLPLMLVGIVAVIVGSALYSMFSQRVATQP